MRISYIFYLVVLMCMIHVATAAPTISGGVPLFNATGMSAFAIINDSYYLRDTSLPMTGENIFRDVTNSNLNLFGGTTTAGTGGIVSVQGKDLAANDAIVFYVPDMTYTANLIAGKFVGGVAQPYLHMNSRQIKNVADPTAAQDAMTLNYFTSNPQDTSSFIFTNGTRPMAGNLSMGGYNISNVKVVEAPSDAVNLSVVQHLVWDNTTTSSGTNLSAVYPIGSVYISTLSTDPKTTFEGFGCWTSLGTGYALVST